MTTIDSLLDETDSSESESKLPATSSNYAAVRFNAMKHGILSRYTVLAHEDADEYQTLHAALVVEHKPRDSTLRAHGHLSDNFNLHRR